MNNTVICFYRLNAEREGEREFFILPKRFRIAIGFYGVKGQVESKTNVNTATATTVKYAIISDGDEEEAAAARK